jgi:hypothetical protein
MNTSRRIPGAFIAAMLLASSALLSAQGTPIPATFAADGTDSPDAVASASTPAPSSRFLGFQSKESFHRFSGWASGGLLLAAGVVGGIHVYDMMSKAHDYRDANHIDEFDTAQCIAEINAVYNEPTEQALRWTHVGLLAAGETFYFANALTGVSLMAPLEPGWNKARIHRYAFFVHAGLMAAEGVLGYFSSDALQRGDHEAFMGLLEAHAVIGFTIPAVILGAGAIMSSKGD